MDLRPPMRGVLRSLLRNCGESSSRLELRMVGQFGEAFPRGLKLAEKVANRKKGKKGIPQRLKPISNCCTFGTTKVVP